MIALTRIFLGNVNNEVSILGLDSKYLLIKVTPLETNGNTPVYPEFVTVRQQIDINGEITVLAEQKFPIDAINHFMHLNGSVIYDLLILIPEWYSNVELKVSSVEGINYDPVNPGDNVIDLTNFYNRDEVDELISGIAIPDISGKADINHNHDDLYYRKSETYNISEIDAAITAIPQSVATGLRHIVINPVDCQIISGNQFQSDSLLAFNNPIFQSYQNPPALNDSFKWTTPLEAGTYLFRAIFSSDSNRGICTIRCNGQIIVIHDQYGTGGFTPGQIFTASFAIAETGMKELTFNCEGKNAASNNYFICYQRIVIYRTGS